VVGIYTGLRILAEVLALRWENVDLVKGFVTVEAAYAKGRQTDTLPINRVVIEALTRLKATARGECVFVSRNGELFKTVRTAFTDARKRVNLTDVTPRTFRYAFASGLGMCARQGTQRFKQWSPGENRR
jgi:integrase